MELLGLTTVAVQNKITVIEAVAQELNIKLGDRLAYVKNDAGEIVLTKQSDLDITMGRSK